MVESLMCPFTMGQAMSLWNKYWQTVLMDPRMGPSAKRRKVKYMERIDEAVRKASEEEQRKEKEAGMRETGGFDDEF